MSRQPLAWHGSYIRIRMPPRRAAHAAKACNAVQTANRKGRAQAYQKSKNVFGGFEKTDKPPKQTKTAHKQLSETPKRGTKARSASKYTRT
jgi:hypothetical protein